MSGRGGLDEAIAAYYAEGREQARLSGSGRLELIRTRELLERFLPPPPAVVLDVGGGAGVYALPLAAQGYAVHLVDPVALHVEQAQAASAAQAAAPLASAKLGDARHLVWTDETVDAVLLLGPLYHLPERRDRVTAIREAMRVLKAGGMLLAAAISRFASTYDGLLGGFLDDPAFEPIVERDVLDGQHRNPLRRRGWFTTAFFHRPDELASEVVESGLVLQVVVAVEGPGSVLVDSDRWLDDPGRRARLLRAIRRVELEPSILGASSHFLAIARRP